MASLFHSFKRIYNVKWNYYRAMHYSAKRGLAIACRLSVCPSVCDVGDHIGWLPK